MAKIKAIGIDLGTTNSAVAWVNEAGRTEMIRNAEGDLLTPSVVLFEDTEVIVGKEAKNAAAVKPDRVAQFVKRDMGAPVYSRPIRGEHLPPEVIQACILRKLKADAVRVLGPDIGAVITVPAYFDEPRRKATADAGEMAGLNVLDIVNEPTAAALGYSEITGYLNGPNGPQPQMNVLVYDLGGGTFDATLLRLAPGDIRTLATDGDVQLGGHDWDTRLMNYVADAFKQLHGLDPREEPAAFNRLYATIVEAKHTLSARSRASLRFDYKGVAGELTITREQFEEITADLLDRTAYTSRQLLTASQLQWPDVSRILLVGGSTRMPMVPRMLQQLTGVEPDRTVNPDEAVARGAAIFAHHLLQMRDEGDERPKFQVTNVNSHSLGIEGIDQGTLRKTNVILIPRNTPLPAKFKESFVTRADNQQSIVIQVLEGESSLPSECTAIGRTVIRDLPPGLPKGWPIEVTFEYAANNRLTVSAVVPGTQRATVLEIERERGLSHEGISGWKQAVTASAGFGGFESQMNEQLRAHGQAVQAAAPQATVQPKVPTAMQAVGQAPAQPGRQHSPIPSRQAWGDGYNYVGSQAALAQTSPGVQPPLSASAAAPAGPSAPVASRPAAPQTPSQPASLPPGTAVEADNTPGAEEDARARAKFLMNVIGFALSSILGLGAGYLLIRIFLPNARLPWLW
ncbi:MAG: Hsp70 family protein [Thermoguttaceae bacterium]